MPRRGVRMLTRRGIAGPRHRHRRRTAAVRCRGGLSDDSARRRVIDAAVECILERGYYQTELQRHRPAAGVTWGAIQYHFGTREALLLEVLNHRWHELTEDLRHAEIRGDTLEERLTVLLGLDRHYGEPEHLAHLQILLDLSRGPTTTASTRKAIAEYGAALNEVWLPLFERRSASRRSIPSCSASCSPRFAPTCRAA